MNEHPYDRMRQLRAISEFLRDHPDLDAPESDDSGALEDRRSPTLLGFAASRSPSGPLGPDERPIGGAP